MWLAEREARPSCLKIGPVPVKHMHWLAKQIKAKARTMTPRLSEGEEAIGSFCESSNVEKSALSWSGTLCRVMRREASALGWKGRGGPRRGICSMHPVTFIVLMLACCIRPSSPTSISRMQPTQADMQRHTGADRVSLGRNAGAVGSLAAGDAEDITIDDSDAEELQEMMDKLSSCQAKTSEAIEALVKQSEETERLTQAIAAEIYADKDEGYENTLHERALDLEASINQNMPVEEWGSGQIGSGNGAGQSLEAEVGMGSTPVKPGAWAGQMMGSGRGAAERMGLRGGGEGNGRISERVGGMSLRGGGNSHSAPKEDLGKRKYTREEHKINKQMCKAVRAGNEEEVKKLLKAGADPCYRWCGPLEYSVMHHGVNQKQFKVVEYLANHGGNIHQRCALGWTLLHQAAHLGELETCEKLIKMGVDITIKNNARRTAPQVAKTNGHKACSQALWAIQEEAEVKKGGHAPAGVPVDNDDDDEVDEEDSDKEREEEAKAAAAAAGGSSSGNSKTSKAQ